LNILIQCLVKIVKSLLFSRIFKSSFMSKKKNRIWASLQVDDARLRNRKVIHSRYFVAFSESKYSREQRNV
jgi:hypothetical protein